MRIWRKIKTDWQRRKRKLAGITVGSTYLLSRVRQVYSSIFVDIASSIFIKYSIKLCSTYRPFLWDLSPPSPRQRTHPSPCGSYIVPHSFLSAANPRSSTFFKHQFLPQEELKYPFPDLAPDLITKTQTENSELLARVQRLEEENRRLAEETLAANAKKNELLSVVHSLYQSTSALTPVSDGGAAVDHSEKMLPGHAEMERSLRV